MPELQLQPLPFDEAIEFFRRKGYAISPNSWRDVWAAQHVRAFTVARVAAMDLLEDIRAQIDKALAQGVPFGDFQRDFEELLQRRGWAGTKDFPPWRVATIFRTNIQSAYQTGRYKQMLEVAPQRPYWMYDAVNDLRTRPSHAALDGKVYRFDHPFWDTWYPPNGWNCRCTVRTLSERDMERRGLREETRGTDLKPDEGFDYNPGREVWQPDLNKYAPPARERLMAAGVDRPRDMVQLQARLNRLRDAIAETGVNTCPWPLHIAQHDDPRYRGFAIWDWGRISLLRSVYREVETAVTRGEVINVSELSAFRTLRHELGHLLGFQVDFQIYQNDAPYRQLLQTVNDLWARHTLPEFLRTLGLRCQRAVLRQALSDPLSGYDALVQHFRRILAAAGLDEPEMAALVTRLNLTVSPLDYSAEIWAEIRRRRPNLDPDMWGHMGEILPSGRKVESLVDALTQA